MKARVRVAVTRVDAAELREEREDEVVVEEPLEMRIFGETLAITMRTPGHDEELALGFLWAEGIVRARGDVASISHCGRTGDERRANTIDVKLVSGVRTPLDDVDAPLFARRGTIMTSACGVCGRRTIDDLLTRFSPVADGPVVPRAVIAAAVLGLRERQPTFARTGGCHAASLLTAAGAHVVTFEDVGRHNAVDKVVGSRLRAGALPLAGHLLVVSGRSSFEIVQKAIAAGIPIVASVSAPSSLAIDLARRGNVTLIGFARGDAMSVYTSPERLG
jgi:FdhD protein